jgi:hypothetical protein
VEFHDPQRSARKKTASGKDAEGDLCCLEPLEGNGVAECLTIEQCQLTTLFMLSRMMSDNGKLLGEAYLQLMNSAAFFLLKPWCLSVWFTLSVCVLCSVCF